MPVNIKLHIQALLFISLLLIAISFLFEPVSLMLVTPLPFLLHALSLFFATKYIAHWGRMILVLIAAVIINYITLAIILILMDYLPQKMLGFLIANYIGLLLYMLMLQFVLFNKTIEPLALFTIPLVVTLVLYIDIRLIGKLLEEGAVIYILSGWWFFSLSSIYCIYTNYSPNRTTGKPG